MKTDLFQSRGHCWVFQIGWHTECSTFTASSFRICNSSIGIPSPPVALFIEMLPKAHLPSHSRMSGFKWVSTPSWLFGSWRSFLYRLSDNLLGRLSDHYHVYWLPGDFGFPKFFWYHSIPTPTPHNPLQLFKKIFTRKDESKGNQNTESYRNLALNEIVCDRFQGHSRYSANIDCCSLCISLDSRLLIFNSCWSVEEACGWQRLWGKIAHSFSLICLKITVQRLPFSIYKALSSRLLLHMMWKESKTTSWECCVLVLDLL